ncbi:MAG: carboxylating nicotinate-nucleotide diphosphorylase [Gammaproteobacteria bacterium]|nr:carboxylating nicotinate-nucleotide diphosphorylase [Gammaproteobacteria bacterium]
MHNHIRRHVASALAEDIGSGDVTAALIRQDLRIAARIISRQQAVLCGRAWFDEVFAQLDPGVTVTWERADGDRVAPDGLVCSIEGPARAVLTGERTALNYLQCLSGTATAARQYAEAVAGTRCKILDTRKTLPGLRLAQKYAVRCGGAENHRTGLFDGILIKENHVSSAGSLASAIAAAAALNTGLPIEAEVENPAELREALAAGADIIMLDNFSLEDTREAVAITDGQAKLEASGNMTLERVREVAETGVDFISIGALTKNVNAIDLSMRVVE